MPPAIPPRPQLIDALLRGEAFPGQAGPVDLVETHASWLLLVGDSAYKLKKPVTLPFLDYGSLDKREACCRAELVLNRLFAPDLYLDVAPIGGSPEQPVVGQLPAIEWAVHMRRFDEAGRLDHLAAHDLLRPEHLTQLADDLVVFHRCARIAGPDDGYGSPERVLAAARENFAELRQLLPAGDQARVESLAAWTEAEFARRRNDFVRRKAEGFVREGHGDLHLGNLVLIDGRVTPFDCIEFNDDFRWNDPVSEVAFLWIDLLDHERPGLAAWFLNAWLEHSGDHRALRVLRFYAVYRAVVRAKIAALRAGQETDTDAAAELAAARTYLALAARIAAPPPTSLTITCGLSGSGKTTASTARLLDPAQNANGCLLRLRSDVERKRLFGLDALAASASPPDGGIYTQEATQRTYRRLRELSAAALDAGWPVIVDAAFLRRAERDEFRALAAARGLPFAILAMEAPVEELRQRIATRRGDASEATLAVLERQLGWFEPLAADERSLVI